MDKCEIFEKLTAVSFSNFTGDPVRNSADWY